MISTPLCCIQRTHPFIAFKGQIRELKINPFLFYIFQAYFLFLFLVIVLSIFSLSLSTEEAFMRELSKCEMIEYLEFTQHSDLEIIKDMLGNPVCDTMAAFNDDYDWEQLNEFIEYYYDYNSDFDDATNTTGEARENKTKIITEQTTTTVLAPAMSTSGGGGKKPHPPPPLPSASRLSSATTSSQMVTSTQKSLDKPAKDQDTDMNNPPPRRRRRIDIPKLRRNRQVFEIIDIALMVCLSLDLLLRLVSCPSLPRYFLSVINLLDVVALAGTYVHFIVTAIRKEQKYVDNWLDAMDYLQILRTLRLFRLVKNVRATKVLVYAVKQSFKDLLILLMFLSIAVCIFASIVYFAEDRADFNSIPTG